jgi:hypothetical protein
MPLSDLLLAAGASLCLLGFVLRGFIQANERDAAQRRLTARQARIAGTEDTLNAGQKPPHPLARHLPKITLITFGLGLGLTLYAFWSR